MTKGPKDEVDRNRQMNTYKFMGYPGEERREYMYVQPKFVGFFGPKFSNKGSLFNRFSLNMGGFSWNLQN